MDGTLSDTWVEMQIDDLKKELAALKEAIADVRRFSAPPDFSGYAEVVRLRIPRQD